MQAPDGLLRPQVILLNGASGRSYDNGDGGAGESDEILGPAYCVACFTAELLRTWHLQRMDTRGTWWRVNDLQEGEVNIPENLPVFVALLLAMTAAFMSGSAEARQQLSSFFAQALEPQIANLGDDPGYQLGAGPTVWLLPQPSSQTTSSAKHAPSD